MSEAVALIIAIDGPSGVGKSTVAKQLAAALEIPYVDTGAMYRTVGWLARSHGIDPDSEEQVVALLDRHVIELTLQRGASVVTVDGAPVGDEIREPETSAVTSRIAVHPPVRSLMVALQQGFARRHGGVLEGRDIGTAVFPETPHRFFLDAPAAVRARRRIDQLLAAGREITLEELAQEIDQRDDRDRNREISPLVRVPGHTYIDSSELSPEQVVSEMVQRVEAASVAKVEDRKDMSSGKGRSSGRR